MAIGIDLSEHNGIVDFGKAKKAGLNFAILRLGYGDDLENQHDKQFARNVMECDRLGIPWGAYIYSYADNFAHLLSEIKHAKTMLHDHKFLYPVFFDVEDEKTIGQLSPVTINRYITTFCTEMEKVGYFAGFYANKNWLDNKISDSAKLAKRFALWYARPGVKTPDKAYGIWQNQTGETNGSFPGVTGKCDTDFTGIDYPAIIQKNGLNNWCGTKEYTIVSGDTLTSIAKRFNTTVNKILDVNVQITNKNLIYPGQKVRLP